eukprot:CAMPEP_0170345114 /NCGR_PEP_ID=MMETSP0116_2-20130129/73780_1 /TAXON_ID=400756 /ORGANISM="Durinskia baltica, Strain CSIRO CS-38" /LENGTH=55 /DNA_ID=CAMNT_0010598863 /DNA_START=18 /DNA_END=182 /DNA_ORIENTATION=+
MISASASQACRRDESPPPRVDVETPQRSDLGVAPATRGILTAAGPCVASGSDHVA